MDIKRPILKITFWSLIRAQMERGVWVGMNMPPQKNMMETFVGTWHRHQPPYHKKWQGAHWRRWPMTRGSSKRSILQRRRSERV